MTLAKKADLGRNSQNIEVQRILILMTGFWQSILAFINFGVNDNWTHKTVRNIIIIDMSASSSEPTRIRKWAPKRSGGCRTCKSRHVRCDNLIPRCTPCKKSSRQCEYSPDLDPNPLKVVLYEPSSARQISPHPGHTSDELRAFNFFWTKVAVGLGGFFESGFWTRDVLRVAEQEDSVWHAIVALSSLSETLLEAEESSPKPFAIQQYTQAVSGLKKTMKDASAEVALVTCAVLVCIEMLQNNYESALSQMSSAVFLFFNSQSSGNDIQLGPTFDRMMIQTILFVDTKPEEWKFINPAFTPVLPSIPSIFGSIEEARDCLDSCMCSLYHRTITSQFQGLAEPQILEDSMDSTFRFGSNPLNEWLHSFNSFKATAEGQFSPGDEKALVLLDIWHTTASILAAFIPLSSEAFFDAYESSFIHIMTSASYLFTFESEPSPLPSFDIGILPSLYFVVSRCRHPILRRQALDLLRRGPKQEGVWHRDMLASIAERIVALEERGVENVRGLGDIPMAARITVINAKICKGERRVLLHCCRQQTELEKGIEVLHEVADY
ncbi:uncharacterized protein LY89DRAFT_736110 [Mollisia scopiformis]|uniref:Zn(2)-C6 fungal-type domain-containing protein n=1 Tax=Mollisia scopiformis TaxID=149040 RepID=A0A194X4Q7_MOLSC|nr:uncharacterized protein LY89DRAFT_736110 [Mollisia scopiformis]KUJ15049.1 hypothetical protein LY89DRAFT_736110 [Mollisia scopiformis]